MFHLWLYVYCELCMSCEIWFIQLILYLNFHLENNCRMFEFISRCVFLLHCGKKKVIHLGFEMKKWTCNINNNIIVNSFFCVVNAFHFMNKGWNLTTMDLHNTWKFELSKLAYQKLFSFKEFTWKFSLQVAMKNYD
jgi:hypothetical protein